MKLYADTSWWFAYKCRRDTHHAAALGLFDQDPEAEVFWTPWQRVEVYNTLRQAELAKLIGRGESRQMIRLFEQEIRLGYWPHIEFDWTDAVRTACEISAEHSSRMAIRGMDLFHIAIAIEVAAEGLLTFDTEQSALATAVGLPVIQLPLRKR